MRIVSASGQRVSGRDQVIGIIKGLAAGDPLVLELKVNVEPPAAVEPEPEPEREPTHRRAVSDPVRRMAALQEASTDGDESLDGSDELTEARMALRLHLMEVEEKVEELAGLKKRKNEIKRKVLERTTSET